MKALFLSCSTGGGHNSAAKALCDQLIAQGGEGTIIDPISLVGEKYADTVANSYITLAKGAPNIFGALYIAGNAISTSKLKSPVYLANKAYADELHRYISGNDFDAIFCPHLFPAEALTFLRRRRGLRTPCFGVATDYACTPFWEETELDAYFLPHERIKTMYAKKGVPEEKLIVTGIPTSAQFAEVSDKTAARRKIGLDGADRIYLVMTGSMGAGDTPALVRALSGKCSSEDRIAVLYGNNDKLHKNLTRRFGKDGRVVLCSFTKEVPLFMDACDVLLSKPGGLSSTEAAVHGIPLIHTAPIPGCETMNAALFEELGMSLRARSSRAAAKAAFELAHDKTRQEAMITAQHLNINRNAARDILAAVKELLAEVH